jgi:glycine cleavage system aminomethyltransferase T
MERIENGLLSYRSDTDDDTDPVEAGLGKWCDMEAGDFVGKAAIVARHKDPDARKLLVNVHIDGDMPASENPWPATIAGQPAGELRVGIWSPKLERNIGLALVPVRYAAPGTTLNVDAEGVAFTMTVTDIPFGDSL